MDSSRVCHHVIALICYRTPISFRFIERDVDGRRLDSGQDRC